MGKEKKQENNKKKKTIIKKNQLKFEKRPGIKCFLLLILRMYTKFHKYRSINKKVDSETRWSP